ncbi:tyrosine-protein phosphatase [Gordonia sp. (in: high G+C Gram-positive bacteria)]|uniref:tyrosine-protein phosphatase n=1 Tax=Gordonia sp. (in: high G+C Gram-positive bacteria) TaxID=84139 RepID=UPI003C7374ED
MTDQVVPAPGAPSAIAALPNLRDLGGWRGADDRPVRYGMLFRSTDFRSLAGNEAEAAKVQAELGLRTVYDLRSTAETEAMPDPKWDDVAELHLDVLAGTSMAVPANLVTVLTNPEAIGEINKFLEGGGAAAKMSGTYRDMVTVDSARESYRRFYSGLLGKDRAPALFHCTTGKDRTGWAAASFFSLMGVSREDIFTDYLLTNDRLLPALAPVFDKFAAAGGDTDKLRDILGVRAEYLQAAFDEVEATHGGIAGYFSDGLGIDQAAQAGLRERFLSA